MFVDTFQTIFYYITRLQISARLTFLIIFAINDYLYKSVMMSYLLMKNILILIIIKIHT